MGPRLLALAIVAASASARADSIPIITLSDVGPDQELPTDRAFYITGDAPATMQLAQIVVVRKGSPSLFGDDGPSCRAVIAGLHVETARSARSDEDDTDDRAPSLERAALEPGSHAAFEVFPRAAANVRAGDVLVSAPWRRDDEDAHRYQILVPHDARFFSAGYAFCLFVVASQRAQELDDAVIADAVDGLARKLVTCGEDSTCHDGAYDEFEARAIGALSATRTLAPGEVGELARKLKAAAREELGATTELASARARLDERWSGLTAVVEPTTSSSWLDTERDPFARALVALLARTGALVPHVVAGKRGTAMAPYTSDGKLAVKALQVLDDGLSIRVAASQAPTRDEARVLPATTDALVVVEGVTVRDLLELGHGRVRVDGEWTTLAAIGKRVGNVGLDWSSEDAAFLAAAAARLRRITDVVDSLATDATCGGDPGAADAATSDRRALGEWLACKHAAADRLEGLAAILAALDRGDEQWRDTKRKLAARDKRIATVATTAPLPTRVAFTSRTWLFSYVTPVVGYAGIVIPDQSFGLFYIGAQVHLDPNPVADIPWRDGVTTRDLRRAIALELAIAPYGGTFGPENRYSGFGGIPPIFLGLAAHVIPYTAFTIGGTIVDQRRSSLGEEQPHAVFAPYIGVALQLNVPDLIRHASRPTTDTAVSR